MRKSGKEYMRSQLIKKDSFADDFNFSRIKKSLSMSYKEGKELQADALNKTKTGNKKKDEKIAKDAKRLLWGFVRE